MRNGENARLVLVAAKEDLLDNLRDALADTNFELLHAPTKEEALALLERLRSEIHIAIVELELQDFDGWDLIRRITFRAEKPVKIIATTSTYPESFFEKIKAIGVDRVVTKTISPEAWHKAVEGVSEENEYAHR